MSGTPRKLPAPLLYFKGDASRVVSTALEQVQVEADGWQLFGPAPESDRFVLLSEVQALLRNGDGGPAGTVALSSPDGHLYADIVGGPRITVLTGHAYFDPTGLAPAAATSIVNGHLVVETGV